MKIIDADNFGSDYPDEKIVAENIRNVDFARVMCEALNERFSGNNAPRWFKIEQDYYQPLPGFEP